MTEANAVTELNKYPTDYYNKFLASWNIYIESWQQWKIGTPQWWYNWTTWQIKSGTASSTDTWIYWDETTSKFVWYYPA
jgi:hypothetical protein